MRFGPKSHAFFNVINATIWTPVVGQVRTYYMSKAKTATHTTDLPSLYIYTMNLPLPLFSLLLFQNILDSDIIILAWTWKAGNWLEISMDTRHFISYLHTWLRTHGGCGYSCRIYKLCELYLCDCRSTRIFA